MSPLRFLAASCALAICTEAGVAGSTLGPGLRISAQIGGPTSAVAIHSSTLLVGVGFRVVLYDVSIPGKPAEVGSTAAFADPVTSIAVAGSRAYVTAGLAGLHIIDVADPARPNEIGAWDSPGFAEGVAVDGVHAFIADGPFGLEILDISEPRLPRLLADCYATSYAYDVGVAGHSAYVAAAGEGLLVADVTDTAHPRESGALDTHGFARRIAIDGGIIYVADEWGGVRVVRAAEGQPAVEIAAIGLPSWAFGVAVAGTTLAIADGSQGLQLYDVTNPAQPRANGFFSATWQHAGSVALGDGRAYLALRTDGVAIVDVHNPQSPVSLGKASPLASAVAVLAANGIAWIGAAEQGFRIVDAGSQPRELASIPLGGGYANSIGRLSNGVLVVGSSGIKSGTISFIDAADPRAPKILGQVSNMYPNGLDAWGSLVAVGTEPGTYIIDATQPAAPATISYLDLMHGDPLSDVGGRVAFGDATHLYATQSADGLRIVDLSDPRNPRIIGTYNPIGLGGAQAVAANGTLAFVAGCSGLWIAETSDPVNPRTLGHVSLPQCPSRVTRAGSTLVIADGGGGIVTVDVTDPTRPRITNSMALPGHSFDAVLDGDKIVAAAGDAGVVILSPNPGPALASEPVTEGVVPARAPADLPRGLFQAGLAMSATAAVRSTRAADAAGVTRIVQNTADDGIGSLRDALSNLTGPDTITFDAAVFPPKSPATIRPKSQLPCVCRNGVTIDASNAGVILDGSNAPIETMGLVLGGNDARIMGLQIVNFAHSGLFVQGSHNVIGGDRNRGTGPSGEGNVISGNFYAGINFANESASDNRVIGNLVGLDASATRPLGTQTVGVFLFPGGPGIVVGGSTPAESNTISGNTSAEVFLQQARGATIIGNRLGTDPSGSKRFGSALMGIGTGGHTIDNVIRDNVIVAKGQGLIISDTGTAYNRIEDNLIGISPAGKPLLESSSFTATGIALNESFNRIANNTIGGIPGWGLTLGFWGTHDNVIMGNRIGTDRTAAITVPNSGGIHVTSSSHVFIGGRAAGETNIIAANSGDGVVIDGPGSSSNFIAGNLVGGANNGNQGHGIWIQSSDGNVIQENTVSANSQAGIRISGSSGTRLRHNSLFANSPPGIGCDDPTAAPPRPVITGVQLSRVEGTACPGCIVEIYSDAASQGQFYEGTVTAASDGRFSLQIAVHGAYVTATASNSEGTSSFSEPMKAPPPPPRRRSVPR